MEQPSFVVEVRDLMLKDDANFQTLVSNGITTMRNVIDLTEAIAAYTAMAMFDSDTPYKGINNVPHEDAKLISKHCGSAYIDNWGVVDFPKTENGVYTGIAYAIKQVYLEKFFSTIDEMEEQIAVFGGA